MDAVIMAAGLGTRLRPHTLTTPKPLLEVQGRPILDWILGAMPRAVERVVVVVNYLAEQIEAYLSAQSHFANWRTVRQAVPQGTGDAFRTCRPFLKSERYLVLNADDLYGSGDLERLAKYSAAMLVHMVDQPEQFGIAFTRTDGTLVRLEEKPKLPGPQWANIGAYVFPRQVFDIGLTRSPRGEYEITEYVSQLADQIAFHAVPAEFWYPIGTIEAWQAAAQADLSAARRID